MFELFAYKNQSEGSLFFLLFESVSLRELWLDLKAAGAPSFLKTFIDLRTRTTLSTRFDLKFFCILKISTSQKASFYHISLEKLALFIFSLMPTITIKQCQSIFYWFWINLTIKILIKLPKKLLFDNVRLLNQLNNNQPTGFDWAWLIFGLVLLDWQYQGLLEWGI